MPCLQTILEQFNPALENLVYLGNNYLRAFHGEWGPARPGLHIVLREGRADPYHPSPLHAALAKAAEVYFKAIEKIGEQALQSSTSHKLGKALPLPILCTTRCHR